MNTMVEKLSLPKIIQTTGVSCWPVECCSSIICNTDVAFLLTHECAFPCSDLVIDSNLLNQSNVVPLGSNEFINLSMDGEVHFCVAVVFVRTTESVNRNE